MTAPRHWTVLRRDKRAVRPCCRACVDIMNTGLSHLDHTCRAPILPQPIGHNP